MRRAESSTTERCRKLIVLLHTLSKTKSPVKGGISRLIRELKLTTTAGTILKREGWIKVENPGKSKDESIIKWTEEVPKEYGGQMYFTEKAKELHIMINSYQAEKKTGLRQSTQLRGEDTGCKTIVETIPDLAELVYNPSSERSKEIRRKIEEDGFRFKREEKPLDNGEQAVCSRGLCVEGSYTLDKEVVVVGKEENSTPDHLDSNLEDEVVLKLTRKSARVLLLVLEENNEEIYKNFTEKISNQLFDQIF